MAIKNFLLAAFVATSFLSPAKAEDSVRILDSVTAELLDGKHIGITLVLRSLSPDAVIRSYWRFRTNTELEAMPDWIALPVEPFVSNAGRVQLLDPDDTGRQIILVDLFRRVGTRVLIRKSEGQPL